MIDVLIEEDLDEVLAIEKKCFTSEWTKENFLYELNDNIYATLFVIRNEVGKIIGYADIWIVFERAEIANIAIDPAYQGQGYGSKLLDHLLDFAKMNEVEFIFLEVRVSNTSAIHLYHKKGFEDLRIRKAYYSDNHEDAIEMIRSGV